MRVAGALLLIILLSTILSPIGRAEPNDLSRFLSPETVGQLLPGVDSVGAVAGNPPAAPLFQEGRQVGLALLTSDVVSSSGYSGKPVRILVAMTLDGRIAGALVAEHNEPILALGISDRDLNAFIGQYAGMDISKPVQIDRIRDPAGQKVDMISGASITSVVFNDSILRAARMVARSRGLLGSAAGGGLLDLDRFTETDWAGLRDQGAIAALELTNAEVARALKIAPPANRRPEDLFITLYTGLATPAAIGQNLLGFQPYSDLRRDLQPGDQAILVAGHGFYSFRGYAWRRSGVFDRIQLAQGDRTIPLTETMHRRIDSLAIAGAPDLREKSLFVLPAASGIDPTRPWRLELLVDQAASDGQQLSTILPLTYQLPDRYLLGGGQRAESGLPPIDRPLWMQRWLDGKTEVIIVTIILALGTLLLLAQDWVVRWGSFTRWIRIGFLVFTLVYLGWITAAQLSVINVLTFANAVLSEFHWEFFLLEPLIFVLWSAVAVALLFWGRGIFCGWLCPFGALQELVNKIARSFKMPQWTPPFVINERLWVLKYVIFLGLFATSLGSASLAATMSEVEPFKTVIALKFARAWPFVLYAAAILVAGLFVQRIFCRFLCPLGAALAIPARNRMFDWLKRRHECGTECHICASRCPVEAIHPDGRINPHECIYCLDCQTLYYDSTRCPPLIERRKRHEERRRLRAERKAARAEKQSLNPGGSS